MGESRKYKKKKWNDRRARKIQLSMRQKKYRVHREPVHSDFIGDEHNLIDYFIKKSFYQKVSCRSKKRMLPPSSFVFYDKVDETLSFLKKIVFLLSKRNLTELYISHSNIREISLSASLVLDLILMDAEKYIKNTTLRKSLNISGDVSKKTDVGILLHANGVLKNLGFNVERDPNVRTLDLLYGNSEIANELDPASKMLTYFEECLKMQKCSMTRAGQGYFGKLLGEVFDNCRIHTGNEGRWYALGFYHNKEERGICHIAIVTVGNTIYESLAKRGNATDETYEALKKMTRLHKADFNKKWNEEMLWTWLSLQHGVSRLRDSNVEKDSNRGMGTMDMMEAFQTIGKSTEQYKPIFTIVSGNVLVEFDFEKYPIEQIMVDGEERRIVSFNLEKSLEVKPDERNVRMTANYFPGTIYTMEFCIDPTFLENSSQNYIRRA